MTEPTTSAETVIRIKSARPGFWRAGVKHPAEPAFYEAGYFSDEHLAVLRAEPMLDVTEITADAEMAVHRKPQPPADPETAGPAVPTDGKSAKK